MVDSECSVRATAHCGAHTRTQTHTPRLLTYSTPPPSPATWQPPTQVLKATSYSASARSTRARRHRRRRRWHSTTNQRSHAHHRYMLYSLPRVSLDGAAARTVPPPPWPDPYPYPTSTANPDPRRYEWIALQEDCEAAFKMGRLKYRPTFVRVKFEDLEDDLEWLDKSGKVRYVPSHHPSNACFAGWGAPPLAGRLLKFLPLVPLQLLATAA